MGRHEIRIDWSRRLAEEPATGHNRWHPDIPPALTCEVGDEVVLETRDAFDGQMGPDATLETVRAPDLSLVHPLTGPVFVRGVDPGDLLVAEIISVDPDAYGFTVQVPGFGFLRDSFPEPFMVRWAISTGYAESPDLPGVRIPGAPFMGTIGIAPSRALMNETAKREQAALDRGGFVLPPSPVGAVPATPHIAAEALRTIPPRETAGNVDIKQLSAGSRLFIPVYVEGALFSAGDAHFAQGDGEVCGTAIEMRSTLTVRFDVIKGEARRRGLRSLSFTRQHASDDDVIRSGPVVATTGFSVTSDGENRAEDLTLAARNAVLAMIELLAADGTWTRQQAYAICSVAVDLKVSELVDVPNFVVSAILPTDIFTSGAPRLG